MKYLKYFESNTYELVKSVKEAFAELIDEGADVIVGDFGLIEIRFDKTKYIKDLSNMVNLDFDQILDSNRAYLELLEEINVAIKRIKTEFNISVKYYPKSTLIISSSDSSPFNAITKEWFTAMILDVAEEREMDYLSGVDWVELSTKIGETRNEYTIDFGLDLDDYGIHTGYIRLTQIDKAKYDIRVSVPELLYDAREEIKDRIQEVLSLNE